MPVTKALLRQKAVEAKLRLLRSHPASIWFLARYYVADHLHRPACTVVSYPKSGRTWLDRLLVGVALAKQGKTPAADDVYARIAPACGMPRIRFTHAGSSWESKTLDAGEIGATRPEALVRGPVILLLRDPRDVLVSTYHHMKFRTGIDAVTADDMVRSELVGLPKLVAFMNLWWGHCRQAPERAVIVRYEEFKADTAATLGRVCAHAGVEADAPELAAAVEASNFRRLQANERADKGANPWLKAADVNNPSSFKMRKGKVGEYREFFTESQQATINAYIREHLRPDMGYACASPVAAR